jgi:transposase
MFGVPEAVVQTACEGHSPSNAQTIFGRGENLDGLRGEHSIAELCRREGIAESLYYSWSKEFLEAGKRRLAGDTARAATSDEVKDLRREAREPKEVVAEQALKLRLLKKSLIADGGGEE